jgi:hypothetical protein
MELFDARQNIDVSVPSPEGPKKATVAFPSDELWQERFKRRRTLVKSLGRGASETSVLNGEAADQFVFEQIRQEEDGGPTFDEFEASMIVDQLSKADVTDVRHFGATFEVDLRVLDAFPTIHKMRSPSARQIVNYRRACVRSIDRPYGVQELRITLEPASEMYKALNIEHSGYAEGSPVPVLHQWAVVQAVLNAVDSANQEDRDPDFTKPTGSTSQQ